jgi:hypothetical protein
MNLMKFGMEIIKMVSESWRESKDKEKKDAYWKTVKTWHFDTNTGEILELYALTKNKAIQMAKAHEKWLHKKGFKEDRVLINTIEEVRY